MIPMRLKAEIPPIVEPAVVRLRDSAAPPNEWADNQAYLIGREGSLRDYDFQGFSLRIDAPDNERLDGDVVLLLPQQNIAHRLIRAGSNHNTFLVTERCDQLCAMCSQPPKRHHVDLFPLFEQAAKLAPRGATVGLSGGEPTLYKQQLFRFLRVVHEERPDLRFHILSNGQHFNNADLETMRSLPHDQILWGIPLYAPDAVVHDEIVGKAGAFDALMAGFTLLLKAGAAIELRTVVMTTNAQDLPELAHFIATNLPYCSTWAIMQLEPIGYGRKNWDRLFFDSSVSFTPISRAINIAAARGIDASLYNFPLCTVPSAYRSFAPSTISDWKRKYLSFCDECSLRRICGGFFEWYDSNKGFMRAGAI
ncbi:His-Xaa-Ser system radical SAM maturase HxsC [Chelatococcus asaccharovorans]|uniref:His-Xaa-Ser system radical SAM maturase HxsC n=2 Tax=Chelatococcus asaccharovorans TaxID=28210 RepID=A0A2V3TUG2_9HYPH|nr:His-Xaa-Ser system radical SAM maturase HxsC [Chelatococcus asaccharovorans]MBS7708109.1 His-Xaa-Ser system radical SAM maturase HxsC [Chelatococcus asaccharovorans]PXW51599.1 His-Xaa-Ser system radical SAM maturase HxsC [Chelatococcus asaccharovorans]